MNAAPEQSSDSTARGLLRSGVGLYRSGVGYHVLLFFLLTAFIIQPWAGATILGDRLVPALYTVTFILALASVVLDRRLVAVGLILLLPSIVTGTVLAEPSTTADVIGHVSSLAFLVLIIVTFLYRIFGHPSVTAATISGTICVYIFLGVGWALAFETVFLLDPGAFGGLELRLAGERSTEFFYFSFTTISTIGYGDLVPLSEAARSLAVTEGIVGQLYLVVLVARFVGLHAQPRPVPAPSEAASSSKSSVHDSDLERGARN